MRPKAQFCHTCGKSLSDAEEGVSTTAVSQKTQELNAEILMASNETMLTEKQSAAVAVVELDNSALPANQDTVSPVAAETPETESQNGNAVVTAPPKKTRRTKRYASRTNYVWEETDPPNWSILGFSILALIIVFVLLWLGNFWR